MRGNLQQSTLAVLLRHLYAERKSGTLHVSSHGLERRLYFRKGAPVFADAGAGERLPARLQAEAILCSTFSWTAGEFSFQDGEPAIDDKLLLGKPPAELILEGTRSIDDTETLARFLGTNGTVFACTQTTELPLFSVKLSPAESAILKLARERERFRVSDLAHVSGELSGLRALNSLVSLGLLEIVVKADVAELSGARAQEPAPVPIAAPEQETARVPAPEPIVEPVPVEALDAPSDVEQLFDKLEAKRVSEPPRVPASSLVDETTREFEAPPPVVAKGPRKGPSTSPASVRNSPRGKGFWGLAALGVGLFALAVNLVAWLVGRSDQSAEAEAVVSAAPSESMPESQPIEVVIEPEADSLAAPPLPTEAELFYQANLAVERRDFEQAKLELTSLLERKPDFAVAQRLLHRVERELAAARAPATKPLPATTSVIVRAPQPKKEEDAKPASVKVDPAQLFDEVRNAFQRGDLDGADAKLQEMRALDPAHPGARELRDELAQRRWEQSLPLSYRARHDHRLGGCDGTLTLTARGIGYRSTEHEWFWNFAELARTDRKDERHLAVDTLGSKNYKFELREPLSSSDWTRFLALGK